MIIGTFGYWRPMTKRERKLAETKAQARAQERRAKNAAREAAEAARKQGSWDRMRDQIAAKYARKVDA